MKSFMLKFFTVIEKEQSILNNYLKIMNNDITNIKDDTEHDLTIIQLENLLSVFNEKMLYQIKFHIYEVSGFSDKNINKDMVQNLSSYTRLIYKQHLKSLSVFHFDNETLTNYLDIKHNKEFTETLSNMVFFEPVNKKEIFNYIDICFNDFYLKAFSKIVNHDK